jgi:2,7-dihydroxy-5-methyl-1-naphthoate 7-O-methyltransferase
VSTVGAAHEDPAWRLFRMADLSLPWALRVVSTLGIADLLAVGPRRLGDLAVTTQCHEQALGRVLRSCVAHNVLTESTAGFALAELGECLRAEHPSRMAAWLRTDGAAARMDATFAGLMHSARTGQSAYVHVHGASFYDDLHADPRLQESFDALMQADALDYGRVVEHLPAVARLIDVGGGTGDLLAAYLQRRPEATGGVFELPQTAEAATAHLAELGPRATVHPGSFFEEVEPRGADAYVLAAVLHNWSDEDAVRILASVARACGPHSTVTVVEHVRTESSDPVWTTHLDLKMLVMLAGRERSAEEYAGLAARAGLRPSGSALTSRGPFALPCAVLSFVPDRGERD